MKIVLINGSPKVNGSSSAILSENLKSFLSGQGKTEIIENEKIKSEKTEDKKTEIAEVGLHTDAVPEAVIKELSSADVWVFACPLYVDGIPGHLLSCLMQLEKLSLYNRKICVYGIVNCGFFEGIQAESALAVFENWCVKAGLNWCGGIGVGGGGALSMVPNTKSGHGPMAPIDNSIASLAEKIPECKAKENSYVSVAMPRILYQIAAQLGWRQMVRQNGGKAKDLGKQWR